MAPRRQLDSVRRFADRAADYVRYRPSYPPDAIDAILEGVDRARPIRVADVGAGTGISARLLADRGAHAIAIEPGADMRRAAASHPRVNWMAATAEATALRAETIDLVLCAQSFHWFDAPAALREFARILRPGGRLALVWNRRRPTDACTSGYRQATVDAGADVTVESMTFDPDVVARSGVFSPPVQRTFPNAQRLDLDGLIGRARSASYVPASGPAADRLHEGLRALYDRHRDGNGLVTLVYDTEVYSAEKR